MKVTEKIERYKDLFQEDPLYLEIEQINLLEELLTPCILYEMVNFDMTYSSKQAAELLEIPGKEQTLLNYLNRNDFISYIDIYRRGERGFYRYDYKTLFQFKMIFLLTKHGLAPFDIAAIIGTRPDFSQRDSLSKRNPINPTIQNVEDIVKKQTEELTAKFVPYIQKLETSILENKKQLEEYALEKWETDIKNIVGRIEDIEINIKIYRNILKRLPGSESNEPKSFWKKLFGTSIPAPSEEENNEYIERLKQLEERYEKLKNIKKELDNKKEIFDLDKETMTNDNSLKAQQDENTVLLDNKSNYDGE